jgi:hypothetical protein
MDILEEKLGRAPLEEALNVPLGRGKELASIG